LVIGLLATLLISAAVPSDPVGARIAASAEAAQALQGPFDGAWALRDPHGRTLWLFQIVDPVGGGSPAGAWREPGPGGASGSVDEITRTPDGLTLVFARPGHALPIRLRLQMSGGDIVGWISGRGRPRFVHLTSTRA
jgi:hypothetical protein